LLCAPLLGVACVLLFAPVDIGVRMRAIPWATLAIAVLLLSVAGWCLPRAAQVHSQRRATEARLLHAARGSDERLAGLRRAALLAGVETLAARDPVRAWGFRAGQPRERAALALFVHASWGHLAANLIGLLVAGILAEQVLGASAVLLLFVLGGSAALWIDAATGSPGTLAGASAGISVLLGACFVLFRDRRVSFRYIHMEYLRPRAGTFAVACPLLAALWLAQQVAGFAASTPAGSGDIAYTAHLAGAALGAGAALAHGRGGWMARIGQKHPSCRRPS
jgi:membrane associated rhomboid family serine protease